MFHLDDVRGCFATEAEFTKTKDSKGLELFIEEFQAAIELYPDEQKQVKKVIIKTFIDTGENLLVFERMPIRQDYPSLEFVKDTVVSMAEEAYAALQQMVFCYSCD